MLSKQKLKKIEAVIQSYLLLFESQKNGKHNRSTVPLAYASGLNLLVKNSTFKNEMVNKENRIKNAKMVRAAKTLVIQFEDFGVTKYAKLTTNITDSIKAINGESRLAPSPDVIMACIDDKIADFEIECDAFYNNLLVDIFNQGRQHQTVVNPNSQVTFRKFATYEKGEQENFDTIISHLKDELFVYLDYFKMRTARDIERCGEKNYSKDEIIKYLNKRFSNHSYDIQEVFQKHCWQAYSFGNLYQLTKDNVGQVAWKTGQHIDDCLTCRAFQTGEAVLKDADGNDLPHVKTADTIIYNINDILKVAKLDGPSFFCHNDCRCEFISAESKKAAF